MPKLLFDVPDFHNPTRIAMSLARRQRLLTLAYEFGFVIVEDDPYRRLRFEGTSVRRSNPWTRTASSSQSAPYRKPWHRVGWAIAEPEIVKRMALHKSDGGSSPFSQRIVADLMRSNRNCRKPRCARRTATISCSSNSRKAFAKRAVAHGVEVSSGRVCFPDDDPGHFQRLAYSFVGPDQIRAGIRQLGTAYREISDGS